MGELLKEKRSGISIRSLGSMRQFLFIFFLFLLPLLVSGQELENYDQNWRTSTIQTLGASIAQKEVKLAVHSFPSSYFQFEMPGNSTVFIDGKLWRLILSDTTFQLPTAYFIKEFGMDTLLLTVVNDQLNLRDLNLSITKIAEKDFQVTEGAPKPIQVNEEKRVQMQPLKDFFALSLFLILSLVAVCRRVYPYLLGDLLQPLSVIKAEDFSESGGLQKVFSLDILLFLLIVSMLLAQSLVAALVVYRMEWIQGWIGETALSLLGFWVVCALGILLLTILKFNAIRLFSYLFDLGKVEFAHFFYLLRLISIGFALVIFVTTFLVINDFRQLSFVFPMGMRLLFWVYLLGILGLFLMMVSRLNFKKYHLFTYLCIVELVPFLVLSKWLMVLTQ